MKRRSVLMVVAGVGVSAAGCLGRGVLSQSSESPSQTPTQEWSVEAPVCPEKPDSFTREDALAFAVQFEKAYVVQRALRNHEPIGSVDVDISNDVVDRDAVRTEEGWIVRFSVMGPAYKYRPHPDSTETVYVDPGMYAANYFVSEETTIRAQAVEAVDPRETGTVVKCPPE